MTPATITLDIDPILRLGPLELAWHGVMTAVGLAVGGWVAARFARRRALAVDPLVTLVAIVALAGIAGSRILFLALDDPAALVQPGEWLGRHGFAIYGAVLAAPLAAIAYVRRAGLSVRYLDALAFGFPFGLAVGRVGDVINGEHYGPPTGAPWGIRWLHPDAAVPSTDVAYHSGGLYEVALGLVLAGVVVALARRLREPTMLLWSVLALYASGRFVMFFWREDADAAIAGLNSAQLVSLAFLLAAIAGAALTRNRTRPSRAAAPTEARG